LDAPRFERLLQRLEEMAAGDLTEPLPLSSNGDHLDALAFGINVLVGELRWSHAKARATEAKQAEALRAAKKEAEDANRAKTDFLHNLSHELRTPLTAILVANDLLQASSPPPERARELLEGIRNNCRSLLGLIQGTLDLSAIEAGRLTVELQPTSPAELVADVIRGLEAQATAKGVAIGSTAAPGPAIATDPRHLRQILVNVIGNAVKFTERGEVRVILRRPVGAHLVVEVIDTGIGVAAEHRGRLFQRFSQADATIGPRFGGTGLGLALSRRLATALGGDLSLVESRLGHGSTFRLTLPADAAPVPLEPTSLPNQPLSGLHILLAEDNADIREALGELLKLKGADITAAPNGQNAIERASARRFDVVLMDLRMPKLDGIAATRALRGQGYSGTIIALTALGASEDLADCVAAGCDGHVAKPVETATLIAEIHRHLRR
jgi:signal transduction histidine kinase